MQPEVTVITPTYRANEEELRRCLGSLRAQTNSAWQQVVCSDGDREEMPSRVVAEQEDPRLCYTNTGEAPRDYGPGVRNDILHRELCNTEFVCFLDDDNVLMPTYLEKMVGAIRVQGADFAICQCLHFGPLRQDIWGKPPAVLTGVPPKLFYIDTIQVVAKTAVMREIGFHQDKENRGYYGDGRTYEELGKRFRYAVVPEILALHL